MRLKLASGCAVLALTILLGTSPSAQAGDIAGKVVLSGEPGVDVVVSIEGLKVSNVPDRTVYVIDHRNLDFTPHVLVVRVGSTVEFKNSDGMPCRIYSVSPTGTFVLSRQDGKPTAIQFDRPGVIEIRCADHSHIHAYLVVAGNPYFAVTDANGRYEISGVPPGRYTLRVWYEGTVVRERPIRVGSRKQNINFRARRPERRTQEGGSLPSAATVQSAGAPSQIPVFRFLPR